MEKLLRKQKSKKSKRLISGMFATKMKKLQSNLMKLQIKFQIKNGPALKMKRKPKKVMRHTKKRKLAYYIIML